MVRKYVSKILYVISFAWQLGFLIITPLAVLLFLGIKIDKYLKTSPFFLLLCLVVALLFISYEIYHWLIPILKNKNK